MILYKYNILIKTKPVGKIMSLYMGSTTKSFQQTNKQGLLVVTVDPEQH